MTSKAILYHLQQKQREQVWFAIMGATVLVGLMLFLVFYNLTDYPTTWFDEGSHLHVPKALVRFGVYADYSSEGFRYYGPTLGVGPTVMLPIAAVFHFFGSGLLQARLVMAGYLLAAIVAFYVLARQLGSRRMAFVATALVIVTPGVALLEHGRQVLGEVPGFFFLLAGLAFWFSTWSRPAWGRLALVGLLLGLAMITKSQYLLILAPSLAVGWLLNLVYYRSASQRLFIVPGLIAAICVAAWQVCLVLYLGPATAAENFALLREASAGAAFVFSSDLMRRSLDELFNIRIYLGALLPALLFGFVQALPRNQVGQRWGLLYVFIVANLVWYAGASIGWLRYAFLGLALTSLFVAQFFSSLTNDFQLDRRIGQALLRRDQAISIGQAGQWAAALWLALMIALPTGIALYRVAAPPFNAPLAMAAYLDREVPQTVLIETWEPEMGFLTDHTYHFPPPQLLDTAVGYIWRQGPPPALSYDYVAQNHPDYVLIGSFARWVRLYPDELLAEQYELVTQIGPYDLFALVTEETGRSNLKGIPHVQE